MIVKFFVKRYLHSNKKNARNKPPRLVKVHSKNEEVRMSSYNCRKLMQNNNDGLCANCCYTFRSPLLYWYRQDSSFFPCASRLNRLRTMSGLRRILGGQLWVSMRYPLSFCIIGPIAQLILVSIETKQSLIVRSLQF